MNDLKLLQSRIKNSRIFKPKKGNERLYFRYGRNSRGVKTSAWFEVVNDRIEPFVKVENDRHPNYYDDETAEHHRVEILKQFHEVIYDCELERQKVPLNERLKDDIIPVHEGSMLHQAQALRFCCSMKVSALFADTGTGKTKVAIDMAVSRYEAGQIDKVLIFCPVSTKKNFRDEIDKWYKGTGLEWKIVGLESMSQSEVTVLETLAWADNQTFIIVDESHNCKTPFAKRSKRIKACCDKCSYKLIMTGTPAESVKDMYMQYAMLSNMIIGEPNWLKFEQKYLIVDDRGDIIGYKNVHHLMGLIEPYTYQIRKEDCMNLPDKHFQQVISKLNAQQKILYDETKNELLSRFDDFDDIVPAFLIFKYFTILQQIACGFMRNKDGSIEDIGTGKYADLEWLNYRSDQTIFFCKYVFELNKIVNYLGRDRCAVFTGQNRQERDEEKDKFTHGEKQFFVATMGTGGTGLNGLQHCNKIVFWSNSFKYTERKQCIGRIDRKGQEEEMYIYDMISNCGIDWRIQQNLHRKGNLANEIKEILNDKTKLKNYVKEL